MKNLVICAAVLFCLSGLGWAKYYAAPPPPILASVMPNTITVGSHDTGVSLSGSNFRSTAKAMLNTTQPLTTNFISSTSLRAIIPAANLSSPGKASVLVFQTGPGSNQSASKSLTITIAPAPAPILTAISPAHVILGSPAFTMTLTGTNFTSSSVVMWDTTALTTTFVSATSLTAAVPNTLYNFTGTSQITVKNSSGTSNALAITKIAALVISTSSLPNGTVGVAYSATLAATGGSIPYSWSVTAGTLPAGLTLNASTGVISGTPTAAAASTFTVTVTDATGTIAQREFKFGKQVSGK